MRWLEHSPEASDTCPDSVRTREHARAGLVRHNRGKMRRYSRQCRRPCRDADTRRIDDKTRSRIFRTARIPAHPAVGGGVSVRNGTAEAVVEGFVDKDATLRASSLARGQFLASDETPAVRRRHALGDPMVCSSRWCGW